MGDILDRLHAEGRKAFLATPSGARPAWLAQQYPEVLRVDRYDRRDHWQGRHNHCPTSPAYRERVTAIDTELSRRFGKHPAVLGWHLSNEYNGECRCPLCVAAFRDWLQERHGDLDTLNEAWWSRFWAHTITDWSQIETIDTSVEGCVMDWRRFITARCVDFMRHEISAVRQYSTRPVTTNMMGFCPSLDYWRLAEHLDFISNDSYPQYHCRDTTVGTAVHVGMVHDLMRTLSGGRPFVQMEGSPSATNWMEVPKLKRPGIHRLEMLQAIAHGADGTCYFQWRKGRGSHEKFHGAVVDHVGHEHTRVFADIAAHGALLPKLADVLGTGVNAPVAIIHDWEVRWALEASCGPGRRQVDKGYMETVQAWYAPCWRRGVAVDLVERRSDFAGYRLLILPMVFLVDDDVAARVRAFTKAGGTAIATYLTGVLDDTMNCHLGGWPGAGLRDTFGVWAEEIDALYPEDRQSVVVSEGGPLGISGTFAARDLCDRLHAEGATVAATYGEQFYAGQPAVTVNDLGKGRAIYVGARTDDAFIDALVGGCIDRLDLPRATPTAPPTGVCVRRRGNLLFALNFTGETQAVDLGAAGTDPETGKEMEPAVELGAWESRMMILA